MNREPRESIWSVTSGTVQLYLALFTVQVLFGFCIIVLDEIKLAKPPLSLFLNVWSRTGPLALTSAALAIITTELGVWIMVLSRQLRESLERKIEERREEGREEANRLWKEWNKRREEAAAQGRDFDEPPPS